MRKQLLLLLFLFPGLMQAQTDYSNRWKDFYSYNNVKDFVKADQLIYALTDNAVFIYNLTDGQTQKISSVEGLSGETTSSIYYSTADKKLIIGYENGLIEVLDETGKMTISPEIVNFNQSGEKAINYMYEYNDKLYLATSFAIVVYDLKKLEFGDTYFIGNGSTSLKINEITVANDQIFAATAKGIYRADITSNQLSDFTSWTQLFAGDFGHISVFNKQLFTSKGADLYRINGTNLTPVQSFSNAIIGLKSSDTFLTISLLKEAFVYNTSLTEQAHSLATTTQNYTLNNAFSVDNSLYLATGEFGILDAPLTDIQNFTEIHPSGPLSNQVFSITAADNNLWVVYGGHNEAYTPLSIKQGYSHFNGETWNNTYFNPQFPYLDLVSVAMDPKDNTHAFISSFGDNISTGNLLSGGGLLEIKDDQPVQFYTSKNSGLEDLFPNDPNRVTTRISSSVFDDQGNLWVANSWVNNKLKKLKTDGTWDSFDLSSLQTNSAMGLNEIVMDKTNSLWIGTRRNGAYVYNETSNSKLAFTTEPTQGSLPNANVRAIAVDTNNAIWIGTQSGLVVFYNASGLFDANTYDAEPVVILDDGIPKKLLGNQTVNTIAVDGADNKWFGTNSGGVLYTNPSGQKTLANFNKDNSPLPSNKILKISVDTSTGYVYFATDKGVVAYNSQVASFGESLGAVYAYPNPALKKNQTITIDGRNGTHLPKGTNVKILDAAGNLVYETNVVEGQETQGGKVVWNKTNLAGTPVASGVYIVLLTTSDGAEKSSTKIAIVN